MRWSWQHPTPLHLSTAAGDRGGRGSGNRGECYAPVLPMVGLFCIEMFVELLSIAASIWVLDHTDYSPVRSLLTPW